MSNLTVERSTLRLGDHTLVELPDFPLKATAKIIEGCMAGFTAAGLLVDAGDATPATSVIGVADATVDNTSGADKAVSGAVRRGAHWFDNSGTNPVVQASMYLTTAKAEDNHTICVAAGTGVAIRGRILGLDATKGVLVEFY